MTTETAVPGLQDADPRYLQWTPVVAGALAATALSLILVTFAATVGLGVSSTSPTWRDASAALWILSGVYLILQAIVSFGFGGYIAGRLRRTLVAATTDEVENRDGLHGLVVWAVAVVLGATVAALAGEAAVNRSSPTTTNANGSAAEPLLSYELDRLFRSSRRPPNVDIRPDRAEAGRILLKSSGHDGVSTDDRAYLIQLTAAATGLGNRAERAIVVAAILQFQERPRTVAGGIAALKPGYFADVAAGNSRRVAAYQFAHMPGKTEFFCRSQHQVDTRNAGDLCRLQLGITAGDHHKALRSLSPDLPDQVTAFLVSIFGDRAGIDDVNIGELVELLFYKTILCRQARKGGCF